MATLTRSTATERDLLATPEDGFKRELVDGEIRVSPAGMRHGRIAVRLSSALHAFVATHRLGDVFDSSTGFRLPSGNVRLPDVAFVAAGQIGLIAPSTGKRPRHMAAGSAPQPRE
jgi:Uma2 family endonuclease